MDLAEITSYLHRHIPITSHLGAVVESYDGFEVCISAPLAPNLNHRKTAFGGSMSALAILAGWTLLHLKLREEGLNTRLVIQKSGFDFSLPIESDFKAVGVMPSEESWERFLKILRRRGRARITVGSRIEGAGRRGGAHEGVYVASLIEEGKAP